MNLEFEAFFFQHFKDIVPLFSAFLVLDEKSAIILIIVSLYVMCPFFSDCFLDFPFIFCQSMTKQEYTRIYNGEKTVSSISGAGKTGQLHVRE